MPWATPTLRTVRETVRGEITTALGRASFIGNSVLRVIADATAALCHLTLRYIDWLALQLLPDTAEQEWLDRHGDIWLVNADGSVGRKVATIAHGSVNVTGTLGVLVPIATQLESETTTYETTEEIVVGTDATPVRINAITPGADGNLVGGSSLNFVAAIPGVDGTAIVIELTGGTNDETDDQLRQRVLRRIQQPPQGGAAHDYEAWALAVPGVTRAWCAPLEMGIGTVTVRILMDDLRADNDGWPTETDLLVVTTYIDTKRPVAVKDFWVLAPIKQFIDVRIAALNPDTPETRAAIEVSIQEMLYTLAAPGQTIYSTWKAQAIMNTAKVVSFDLLNWEDDFMESPGHMAVLGDIIYAF